MDREQLNPENIEKAVSDDEVQIERRPAFLLNEVLNLRLGRNCLPWEV